MEENRKLLLNLKKFILFSSILLFISTATANNISISSVSFTNVDYNQDLIDIQFDISWENSWRTSTSDPYNWDAAWVFAKYRLQSQTDWHHATFSTSGHTAPSGSTISVPSDGVGAFIYRSSDGSGTFSLTDAELVWDYGTDGLSDNEMVELKLYAIEMVYVPQDVFYLGSGGEEEGTFYKYPTITDTYKVNSESAINVGETNGYLNYSSGGDRGDGSGPIPANFPKGYDAFYCMKYEISQEQYAEFLNTLDNTQASARYTSSNVGNYRYQITNSGGTYSSSLPYVPCNYFSWDDFLAYLDWCGLRPMTELEFEKACRGDQAPVAGEYATGTDEISPNYYEMQNGGAANESVAEFDLDKSNVLFSGTFKHISTTGPLRCGLFAAHLSNNNNRVLSGSTYYGIMEMSGNLWELVVSAGSTQGRAFTGNNGDGELDSSGDADVTNWPDNYGTGFKGGSFQNQSRQQKVSNRRRANKNPYSNRVENCGGRGVRNI